ncbi:MAG: BRO-N domain-containing protein [Cetobacterium sp.]
MLKTSKVIVPFSNQELTSIKSRKKDELCFFGQEVIKVTNHKNLSQALKDADCILNEDYVVIKKKDNIVVFQELLSLLLNPFNGVANNTILTVKNPNKIQELTLIYESGFWKLSLSSKLPNGKELRKWLANDVLPSIRKTGKFILSTIDTNIILESTKREIQIQKSKEINTHFYELKGQSEIIKYNANNCKQVTGMYPNEIKARFNSNESAKEILRKRKPELASTMCLNDSIMVQDDGVKLSDLKEFDKIAIALFCEAEKIGLRFKN